MYDAKEASPHAEGSVQAPVGGPVPGPPPHRADGPPPDPQITEVLLAWSDGNAESLERLLPLVLDELRRIAHGFLQQEAPGHTLQPTALVNELYLRLAGRRHVSWKNRAHFFGFAAQTMRRILVDHARAKQTAKRGQGGIRVTLDDLIGVPTEPDVDLVRLDDALRVLAEMDPRQSQVVELRFFAGLTFDEIAEVLGIGVATVGRDWASARTWLFRELEMR